MRQLIILGIALVIVCAICSCDSDVLPKPKGYLRLEYPPSEYVILKSYLPFLFQKNKIAIDSNIVFQRGNERQYGLNLRYSKLKGTIYLTYKSIGNREDLINYLRDAQNFTIEHTVKADEITEQLFKDKKRRVYGMFYEVGGNAASQSQFYITDSIDHFISGSLYFYIKPNYDSIFPAAEYLKDDIRKLMETIEWK